MYGLLMQQEEWKAFTWTGIDPATEYTFAYIAEDWNGVLTDVKIVKSYY